VINIIATVDMNKKYYSLIKSFVIAILITYAAFCLVFYVAYGLRLSEIELIIEDLSIASPCEKKLHEIVITLRKFLLGTSIVSLLPVTALIVSFYESRENENK